jgi:tripartite-type tricarboxylate transporter receptor subunit TctC
MSRAPTYLSSLPLTLPWIAMLIAPIGPAYGQMVPGGKFPARTIRIVVPYPASGPVDLTTRTIVPRMSEALGQSIIVDNRPGGSTILGTELVARAPPDGHTLLMVTSTVSINPSVQRKLPYDTLRDLAPVTIVVSTPFALVVHPSLPARSVTELVRLASAKPDQLLYSTSGTGSANHLAVVHFSLLAGIKTVQVPYKGTAQSLTDLMAGHVHFAMNNPLVTLPHTRQGKLRLLALTSKRRLAVAPGTPTVAESGLPGYEAGNWHAMFATGGTPAEVTQRLRGEVVAALAAAEVKSRFTDGGAELGGMPPDEFTTYLRSEIAKWGKAVKAAGVQPE